MRLQPLAPLVVLLALSACGGSSSDTGPGRTEAAAGFYPYAFVAERVGGQDADVTNLTTRAGSRTTSS
jgi:zinc transport system substrate-binding protein